ncbi:MAG: XRE family transcriptional regulator [Candidatus Promineifilaceae bacterium]|nr:XRE family transcriptional regulator [Candidatus Promineifilaceae bacterium]
MSTELVNVIFGMKVRQARTAAGLTQAELAAAADLSPSYLTEIEKGRKYPRADKILRMADALDKEYDELVSIKLGPSLAYLERALASPLLQDFPFEEFGLDASDVVALLTQAPDKASALLHAILEIGRQYDLGEEHFLRAVLRSHQEIHDNYFPDIEEAAAEFAQAHQLDAALPLPLETLQSILVNEYDYQIDTERLAAEPALSGYRAVYVPTRRPRLLVNSRLRPRQIKFLLAREMGYHHLQLAERSAMSSPERVDSFRQVLNDFKASYFAGALLMPRQPLLDELQTLFQQSRWQPERLTAMLARFEVTPEMLFYRFSELVPEFFGLKLHFLRMHRSDGRYRLIKRLNMNQLPIPSGLALYEHYCRRWLSTRLLRETESQAVSWSQPLVGVQQSEFLESGDRYLCLGFARPLVLQPGVFSSVVVGFRYDAQLPEVVAFVHDAAVPSVVINETCERCPLTAEQCTVRAAPPTRLAQAQRVAERRQALNQLMAEFRG